MVSSVLQTDLNRTVEGFDRLPGYVVFPASFQIVMSLPDESRAKEETADVRPVEVESVCA